MNLDQIATKCFILALFIRDDGQRLLLGDGYYDFNQKLQHFQGNTIANDIVEIQGDNGQLLAGQVMRSGAQKFEGYIGDATTNRQTIEQKRSDFMAFFRIKHFYKVIYIFPDGTAIQRQRGYLTDAPTIPEIFQKFPEYSVALNFEDANYYEYAEDEHGDEIYAHIAELALAGGATGGLIWDAIGAVTNGITWSGIQTAQGEYISITNELDIPAKLASVEMLGNAEQDGTPTPDAPVAVETTTGENVVKIEGKNLWSPDNAQAFVTAVNNSNQASIMTYSGRNCLHWQPTAGYGSYPTKNLTLEVKFRENTQYTLSYDLLKTGTTNRTLAIYYTDGTSTTSELAQATDTWEHYTITSTAGKTIAYIAPWYTSGDSYIDINSVQLELGSTATAYEPYQGQEFEVNLGKNLWNLVSSFTNSTSEVAWVLGDTAFSIPAGTYTFSCDSTTTSKNSFVYKYADNVFNSVSFVNKATITFTEEVKKVALLVAANTTISNLQLELGSQATSYSPYFTPIELAKIGNYQDRIYKDDGKWYIEKQVGKVVLDGSEANWGLWGASTTNTLGARVSAITPAIKDNGSYGQGLLLSDHFTETTNNTLYATDAVGIATTSSNLYFRIAKASLSSSDLAGFESWLSTHNTTVYYALATPTTTEITNEALIAQLDALESASLYLGVNNIGTETLNAMPTLKIEYYTAYTLEGVGYEWEPGGNTAKTIVTVAGVDSAWPIWTIQGGAQNPTLTNITTGQTISWQGFVPEGQTLTINMAEMTADLAGANVFEYITGEWLRLAPGNNTLVYTAGSADKPSTLSWNGVLA